MVADKKYFKEQWTKFIRKLDDSFKKWLAEEGTHFSFIEEVLNEARFDGFSDKLFDQITKENHEENTKILIFLLNEIDFFLNLSKDTSAYQLVDIADIILQSLMELFELELGLKEILEGICEAKEIVKVYSNHKSTKITKPIHAILS